MTAVPGKWENITATAVRLDLPERRTVVVVPHPDDEALLSGGLITRQTQRGAPVIIVAVTDGEAAYPSWPAPGLGRVRQSEQTAALRLLEISDASTIRLRLPDGKVASHERELTDFLETLIEPDDLIVAPWVHDWHPDHEACGRAALRASNERGATLLGSLFWAYHQVDPAAFPNLRVARLRLTESEVNRRTEALDAHRSQLQPDRHDPILAPQLLDHLRRDVEHFVVAS